MEKSEQHQTFDQGAREAIEMAICTLVRVLPPASKQAFMKAFPANVATWDDVALPSSRVSDEWLKGFRETAESMQKLMDPKS